MNKMCSDSSVYFKTVLCENEKQYRIHTVWNDNNFILTVIDDFKVYKSNVSKITLKNLATKYEAILDTYIEEIRNSLTDKDVNNIIFNREGNIFTISRKQYSISVQFADFILDEIGFNDSAINIMDKLNTSSQFFQRELLVTKKQMETVVEEKNQCVLKLEEFANKKKDMERELYSKFILLLNEKKRRIQYLQETLEKFKKGKRLLDIEPEERSQANGTKREVLSDSDTETSVDEPVETIVHNVQIECHKEKAKKILNFSDDDDDRLTITTLPKRAKITEISKTSEKVDIINDAIRTDDNIASTSKEITKSPEITIETNVEESQNSLNFNTQDLFDRL